MLTRIEAAARRPFLPVVLVGGMALAMVSFGAGPALALLWAVPTCLALELLRRERPWLYLRLGRDELAIAAARSLVAESPARVAPVRMAEALAAMRLGQFAEAKAALAEIDAQIMDARGQCGLFLMRGSLALEVGDEAGVTHWSLAAEAAAGASGETSLIASVERFRVAAKTAQAAENRVLAAVASGRA